MAEASGQPSRDPVMRATSSGKHAWFVVSSASSAGKFALMHYAPGPDGESATNVFVLDTKPRKMAAWANRVWLIDEADSDFGRRVLMTRIVQNPTTGLFTPDPPRRMELGPPLGGTGVLAGLVGTERGPVALLAPPQHANVEVTRTPPVPGEPVLRGPRLVRLEGLEWIDLELPESVRVTYASRLAVGGVHGDAVLILTPSQRSREMTNVYTRRADDQWDRAEIDLNLYDVRDLSTAGSYLLAASQRAQQEGDSATIYMNYIRLQGPERISEIEAPVQPWAVLGFDDGIRLFADLGQERISMRRTGMLGGAWSDTIELARPTASPYLWYGSLLFALAIGAVFFVLIARPSDRIPTLSEDTVVLGLLPRFSALAIDLAPASIVAMILTGTSIQEFVRLPIATIRPEEALAYVIAMGFTTLHSCVGELLWKASLGKWLMGGRIVAADGSKPGLLRLIIRNGVKLMILLIPPLGVIMLLSPYLQGLNDLIARTVVIRIAVPVGEGPPPS